MIGYSAPIKTVGAVNSSNLETYTNALLALCFLGAVFTNVQIACLILTVW